MSSLEKGKGSYSEMKELVKVKDSIDPREVNRTLTVPVNSAYWDYINQLVAYGAAQALQSHIVSSEKALLCRDALPIHDLLNGAGTAPINSWKQTYQEENEDTTIWRHEGGALDYKQQDEIYEKDYGWTRKDFGDFNELKKDKKKLDEYNQHMEKYWEARHRFHVDHPDQFIRGTADRKVLLVYGLEHIFGSNMLNECWATEMSINRGNVKRIGVFDVDAGILSKNKLSVVPTYNSETLIDGSQLYEISHKGVMLFDQPIMFKPGDSMRVSVKTKEGAKGKSDYYRLLAFVFEALGATATC